MSICLNCTPLKSYFLPFINYAKKKIIPIFPSYNQVQPKERHYIDLTVRSPEDWKQLHADCLKTLLEGHPQLKEIISKLSADCIKGFYRELFKHEDQAFISASEKMLENLPLSHPFFSEINQDAHKMLSELSKYVPEEASSTTPSASKNTKNAKIITSFLPNLAHIFLRAFDLLNFDRPPETLYEYGVLVTLYINFFTIPYHLIYVLNALIGNPALVLAIAAIVIATSMAALYIYLSCIRQCPAKVSYCAPSPNFKAVGFEDKYEDAKRYFHRIDNIALVGEPGTGKTAFIDGMQSYFSQYKVIKLKSSALAGGGGAMLKVSDRIEISLRDIAGFNDQVILCYDELGDAMETDSSMANLIREKLNTRFVGAMKQKQWDNLPKDIQERFKVIRFGAEDRRLTEAVLLDLSKKNSITFTDDVLQELIAITDKEQGEHAQPRKSVTAYNELQDRISLFDIETYTTPELKEKKSGLKSLQEKIFSANSLIFTDKSEELFKAIETIRTEMIPLETKVEQQKSIARTIKAFLGHLKRYREQHVALVRIFKKHGNLDEDHNKQFIFTHFYAIPTLMDLIRSHDQNLNPDVYIHLNKKIVQDYFDKKRKVT